MKIRQLTNSEIDALNSGLKLASSLVDGALDHQSVQALYDSILISEAPTDDALIALGLAFGKLIVEFADFEWVRLSDEYGEETSVAVKDTQLLCSPISMIQKRIERSEKIDISDLVQGTVDLLREKVKESDVRKG